MLDDSSVEDGAVERAGEGSEADAEAEQLQDAVGGVSGHAEGEARRDGGQHGRDPEGARCERPFHRLAKSHSGWKAIEKSQSDEKIKAKLTHRQSINQPKGPSTKDPPLEKLPHGDDFRVGPKSDRTPRDNTVIHF